MFLKAGLGAMILSGLAPSVLAAAKNGRAKTLAFAICNEIFKDWKFEDVAAYAAKTGYKALEIAPFTFADSATDITAPDRRKIRETAARHHLEIAGIHWVMVKPEGLYINHTDPQIRARTAQYLCDLVDFCADIGGRVVVVGSPKQRDVLPGVSYQQAWEWAAECFRPSVAQAGKRKVTLCLEPLSPANTNFINTAEEAIRFVAPFKSKWFKIILDTYAMCSEQKQIPDIIKESAPHFVHYHANDRNMKGPGFGNVDFARIATALRKADYNGYVSVEVFNFDDGPEAIATKSLTCLQAAFGNVQERKLP